MNTQNISPLTIAWELREAIIAARNRLGDSKLASRVKGGMIQIVRAIPNKSVFDIAPLTGWMKYGDAVQHVKNMNAV